MNEFLDKFGIDWRLLLSQTVNFALILIILRIFVYKPLLSILKERREKIEKGLAQAEESEIRLKEIDQISAQKLKKTDEKCIALLSETDIKKKELEKGLALKAKQKEEETFKKIEAMAENQKKELAAKLQKEAGEIVRSAIAKAIEEKPEQIDEKLIQKTVSMLKT